MQETASLKLTVGVCYAAAADYKVCLPLQPGLFTENQMCHWEVGSEFEWSDRFLRSASGQTWFPQGFELFATGTGCLRGLASIRIPGTNSRRKRIHLPSYYCMEVAEALMADFEVCWYGDVPTNDAPDFDSIHAEPGDFVLVLNSFGIRERDPWTQWRQRDRSVVVIEDHSHDPFGEWARTSTADYAFASLRKTLPVPDGGMLYSPKGHDVPVPISGGVQGAADRIAGMILKNAYLSGVPIEKSVYRQLEQSSHRKLAAEPMNEASCFTRSMLPVLDIAGMRRQKQQNIAHFLHRFAGEPNQLWTPLFDDAIGLESVPLNVVVVCESADVRETLRTHLIGNQVFPAIHWPMDSPIAPDDLDARWLADRIMTVPIDFRYGIDDVDRVFALMQG